jgi:hypothetical protein
MFAAVLAMGMLVANGCDMRQLVKVNTPPAVLESLEVEGPISLAEADAIYADWQAWVDAEHRAFREVAAATPAASRPSVVDAKAIPSTLPRSLLHGPVKSPSSRWIAPTWIARRSRNSTLA